jgi:A/G-specific adenine glycosylase
MIRRGNHKRLISALLGWFEKNARDLPWRRTSDPYGIWVSEIMLQQTQVKTVIPYWERWMRTLPSISALARSKPEKIHKLWEGLGYYTRVRNMQAAAKRIVERHNGKFPEKFEDVLSLPGIGRYTAGAICSIAFSQPRPILDGNVTRVLSRVFGIEGDPRKKAINDRLWQMAKDLVEEAARIGNDASQLNQSLMELGAIICAPKDPQCGKCPVAKACIAHKHGRVHELPRAARRPRVTARHFAAFIVENRGRFLVRQRLAGVVNAHLWEFPNIELKKKAFPSPRPSPLGRGRDAASRSSNRTSCEDSRAGPCSSLSLRERAGVRGNGLSELAQTEIGLTTLEVEPFCTIRHSITRYRITMEVFRVRTGEMIPDGIPPGGGQWMTRTQLPRLAFASAHKKVLQRLGFAR